MHLESESTEDAILDRVMIETLLTGLSIKERLVIVLAYTLSRPADWTGCWPPTNKDIGLYVGPRYGRKALSEGAIRNIRKKAMVRLRELAPTRAATY